MGLGQVNVIDQMEVKFGQEEASSVTLISMDATRTVLSVVPPPYDCDRCTVRDGAGRVTLSVTSRGNAARSGSVAFDYLAAPTLVRTATPCPPVAVHGRAAIC